MSKFIVITGLDGTGTSSVAEDLKRTDPGSVIIKTPEGPFLPSREEIDRIVRIESPIAHYYYYLSAVIHASEQIECLLKKNINVYCVRYLIDTVVSHRVMGLPVELIYETELHRIRRPDITLFLSVQEEQRQARINARGKGLLDQVLDDDKIRSRFLAEFQRLSREFVTIDTTNRSVSDITNEAKTIISQTRSFTA